MQVYDILYLLLYYMSNNFFFINIGNCLLRSNKQITGIFLMIERESFRASIFRIRKLFFSSVRTIK